MTYAIIFMTPILSFSNQNFALFLNVSVAMEQQLFNIFFTLDNLSLSLQKFEKCTLLIFSYEKKILKTLKSIDGPSKMNNY